MDDGVVSKTKRKQEMTALQVLGARLVDLPESQIAELPMEERLRDAVLEANGSPATKRSAARCSTSAG